MAEPAAAAIVEIRDHAAEHRYELLVDGQIRGYLDYRLHGTRISILHTEVDRVVDGQGYGSRLARHALLDARARGLRVMVHCPFVRSYVQRHREFADLLNG